nr:MAG TPA: hypothetical protein [Caudoviricetes sp.]
MAGVPAALKSLGIIFHGSFCILLNTISVTSPKWSK